MEVSEYLERKSLKLKEKDRESSSSFSLAQLLATCFGVGYLPYAPGTWAALVTVGGWFAVYTLTPRTAPVIHISVVALLVPFCWITSGIAARQMGVTDPSVVVIDEVLGQSATLLFCPVGIGWFLGAFAVFRFFDILKPPPIRRCEAFPGGLGITLDDLVAGVYGGLVLWLIHAL